DVEQYRARLASEIAAAAEGRLKVVANARLTQAQAMLDRVPDLLTRRLKFVAYARAMGFIRNGRARLPVITKFTGFVGPNAFTATGGVTATISLSTKSLVLIGKTLPDGAMPPKIEQVEVHADLTATEALYMLEGTAATYFHCPLAEPGCPDDTRHVNN